MVTLPLLTVREASLRLSVSQSQIYRLIASCELTAIRVGKAIRIRESDLINFARRHETSPRDNVHPPRNLKTTLKHLGTSRNN